MSCSPRLATPTNLPLRSKGPVSRVRACLERRSIHSCSSSMAFLLGNICAIGSSLSVRMMSLLSESRVCRVTFTLALSRPSGTGSELAGQSWRVRVSGSELAGQSWRVRGAGQPRVPAAPPGLTYNVIEVLQEVPGFTQRVHQLPVL